MPRIRDKLDAQVVTTMYGFVAAIVVFGALEDFDLISALAASIGVLAFPTIAGFLARWGWELRRWYRKTRPGHDPLVSLRPKG